MTATDCDRLDAAFGELDAAGIVARQDFACCNNCGYTEIGGQVAPDRMDEVRGLVPFVVRHAAIVPGGSLRSTAVVTWIRAVLASALVCCIMACTPPPAPESPPPPPSVDITEEQLIGTWKIRYSSQGTMVFTADHTVSMTDVPFTASRRRLASVSGTGEWSITESSFTGTPRRDTVKLRFSQLNHEAGEENTWMRAADSGAGVILTFHGYNFVKA